jgi:lysosomal acid phosphatase
VLAMKQPCPRYDLEFVNVMESPQVRKINSQYKEVYDYVTEHSGRMVQDPIALQYVFNTLWIEQLKNMRLPEWTNKVYPDRIWLPLVSDFRPTTRNSKGSKEV